MIITAATNTSQSIIAEGHHNLTLAKVELKRVADKFAQTADGKIDKFLWLFRADGGAEYAVWTKTAYGDERADLTKLLNEMIPGMNASRLKSLDTDDLVGKRFRARIVHKVNAASGKTTARHQYIEPLDAKAQGAASLTPMTATAKPVSAAPAAEEVNGEW